MTKRTQSAARKPRRKSNPMTRRTARVPRPRMNFDGQNLDTTLYAGHSNVGSVTLGLGSDWHAIDCSNGEGINRSGTDVVRHYQDYKYQSAAIEWLPSIGPNDPNSGGRIYLAYIDNPEHIVQFKAGSDLTRRAMAKNVRNVVDFNMWERYTWRVPLTYRRKLFNTDVTIAVPGNEETDRAIQGLVLVIYETFSGTAAAGTLGQFRINSVTWLKGFTASILT